jgi:hypothetical protein
VINHTAFVSARHHLWEACRFNGRWQGWIAAVFRPPAHGSATTKPGQTTRLDLLAAGWQESDQGVFTRRCQDNCRTPVVYGSGMADVMDVHCLDRPCGEIRAAFVVLDDRGCNL